MQEHLFLDQGILLSFSFPPFLHVPVSLHFSLSLSLSLSLSIPLFLSLSLSLVMFQYQAFPILHIHPEEMVLGHWEEEEEVVMAQRQVTLIRITTVLRPSTVLMVDHTRSCQGQPRPNYSLVVQLSLAKFRHEMPENSS